ncbi:MAG: TVP38/TMEM64 family protein [Clostridia bacterium]|nr:TVP38/TMEM64 family protein [Clostridia bacterium]
MSDRKASKAPMKKAKASLMLSIVSAVFLALTVLGLWLMRQYLSDPEAVRARIGEHYVLGAIALIIISAVQVVLALVPSEVVEIAAGYVFGSWTGALLCLVGIVLGSCSTILLVRKYGSKFVYAFYPKEKIDSLPIINDPPKRNLLTFILFVIPGTPKDLFTYAIGLTSMSIPLYIALTSVARFPSVILSTVSGSAAGEENYTKAIIFAVITAAVSGIGLLLYRILTRRIRQQRPDEEGSVAKSRKNLRKKF